jgi:hypothetical protein
VTQHGSNEAETPIEAWHALGNSYLLLQDAELTPERVRELAGDADGILAVEVTGPDTADVTI